jgi:hypothetical protein
MTESAAVSIGVAELALLEQAREEPLREILRLISGVSLPPDEPEDRIPVQRAETRQRFLSIGRTGGAGGEDETPLRRREAATIDDMAWNECIARRASALRGAKDTRSSVPLPLAG